MYSMGLQSGSLMLSPLRDRVTTTEGTGRARLWHSNNINDSWHPHGAPPPLLALRAGSDESLVRSMYASTVIAPRHRAIVFLRRFAELFPHAADIGDLPPFVAVPSLPVFSGDGQVPRTVGPDQRNTVTGLAAPCALLIRPTALPDVPRMLGLPRPRLRYRRPAVLLSRAAT